MKNYFKVCYEDEFGLKAIQQYRIETRKEAMEIAKECQVNWNMDFWVEEYEFQIPADEKIYAFPNSVDGWEDIYNY